MLNDGNSMSSCSRKVPRKVPPKTPLSLQIRKTPHLCKQRITVYPLSLRKLNRLIPPSDSSDPPPEKTEKEIQLEIQSIFRQITASVTFLPQLEAGDCTFNVLVYADSDSEVPMEWGDSDAKEIENGEKVQLRSFSTSNHRVDTLVSYRLAD